MWKCVFLNLNLVTPPPSCWICISGIRKWRSGSYVFLLISFLSLTERPSHPFRFPSSTSGKEFACQCRRPQILTWVQSQGWEDAREEGMATSSSIFAWRIPWTEEPAGLQSRVLRGWHNQKDSIHHLSLPSELPYWPLSTQQMMRWKGRREKKWENAKRSRKNLT